MKDNQLQKVYITLSNGRQGVFVGAPIVDKQDEKEHVISVAFSLPSTLPEGYMWEDFELAAKKEEVEIS